MNFRKIAIIAAAGIVILLLSLTACSGTTPTTTTIQMTLPPTTTSTPAPTTTPTGPGGGAVINSDSVITGKINAIRPQTSGYPWEVDVLIQTSQNVGDLPNPTADKVGQIVTLKTDQDLTSFRADEEISAKVKYTGDVPKPGITPYIYDIKEASVQGY